MRTGRPQAPIVLTAAERATLESLAHRSRTRPHMARRARIILLCSTGMASNVAARKLHVRAQDDRQVAKPIPARPPRWPLR
jgi:hypothetical protein